MQNKEKALPTSLSQKSTQATTNSFNDENKNKKPAGVLEIGYYPIRGKAQVPRLIMEYLHVSYFDRLFDLDQWDKFKRQQIKDWDFTDLPYLIDQNPYSLQASQACQKVIITQAFPICIYIIEKYNRTDLLGKTLEDKAIVQMYLWTIQTMSSIININCTKKAPEETIEEFKQKQWKINVLPRMYKYENFVKNFEENQFGWFLGYLTLIDFSIYQLMRYMNMLFPGNQGSLPNLNRITRNILKLPEIQQYESSIRCIKQMDPSTLLKKLKSKST